MNISEMSPEEKKGKISNYAFETYQFTRSPKELNLEQEIWEH